MIIEVENKSSLTVKICLLQSRHTEIFSKGLTQDFGQKLVTTSLFVFWQISLEIMSDDLLVKSTALSPIKGASNVFSFKKIIPPV